ncbi:hypothetical protein M569_11107 [Genlisea aurea]|uniref:Uncharacterized protein n=1 Tax=Genlisea aurea TaxID=192259 RepID=S8CA37_9LAMI|nr:hypothetical protein M569_11107 [Genlisea aurea]
MDEEEVLRGSDMNRDGQDSDGWRSLRVGENSSGRAKATEFHFPANPCDLLLQYHFFVKRSE